MVQSLGQQALASMVSHFLFIIITWRILQGLNLDGWFKKGRVFEAQAFMILLTITIGTSVSRFFLDFMQWSQYIGQLF